MAFEVITTTDKAQRDAMFEDLRKNGNDLEKQVVKFSGAQLKDEGRPQAGYVSNWSVAYPLPRTS